MWPQSASDLLNQVIPVFCDGDYTIAKLVGLTTSQFALAKAGIFTVAFVTLAFYLYASRRRFNRNGFTNQVWWACFCLLIAISLLQVLNILSVTVWHQLVPCPFDVIWLSFALFMGLYAIWFYHLGQAKTGSFARYFSLVVVPLYGDLALNARQATLTGVRGLMDVAAIGLKVVGHLMAHA